MRIQSRYYTNAYRYGFNGQEKDDEFKGAGNSLDFGARIYDPRLGRFLSIDPLFKIYPEISPYAYCANSPIQYKEVDGRGFNGGFSVENQSSKPVVLLGSAATVRVDAEGNRGEPVEGSGVKVTLQPGQRLETYLSKPVKLADGSTEQRYTSRIVDIETGEVVVEDAGIFDVDFVQMDESTTWIDNDGGERTTENTKTKGSNGRPWPLNETVDYATKVDGKTERGQIKLQPGLLDGFSPSEDGAGEVIIKTNSEGNTEFQTKGDVGSTPTVINGDKNDS